MDSCPEHLAQSASIHSEQVDHTNRGCSLHQLSSYLSQLKLSGMLKLKYLKEFYIWAVTIRFFEIFFMMFSELLRMCVIFTAIPRWKHQFP